MTSFSHRVLFALSLPFIAFSSLVIAQQSPSDKPVSDASVLLLGHEQVAIELQLAQDIRQQLAVLLQQRASESVDDSEVEAERLAEIDTKMLGLLTDSQRTQFAAIAGRPRLLFNFREAKWIDVLNWFARQSGLSLLVNNPPPDSFTYSDTRTYSPREAIDLLNGVLVTKGYTLIRKDRLLVCIRVADGIPDGLIPETTVDGLSEYGSFDLVKVTFSLGKKPVSTVTSEIEPLLGAFGGSLLLPQSKRLIVTSTAGNMRAIAATIDSIKAPEPPKQKPKEEPKPAPKPELVTYDASPAKAAVAADLLKRIIGESLNLTLDEEANRFTVYSIPGEHGLIEKVLKQLKENSDSDNKPYLEIYPFDGDGYETLASQAAMAAKEASLNHDEANRRILVFANKQDQAAVVALMEKLSGQANMGSDSHDEVEVLTVNHADVVAVAEALDTLFPSARVSTEPELNKLVIRATPSDRQQISQLVERLDKKPARQTSVRFIDALDRITTEQADALKVVAPEADIRIQQQGRRLMVIATLEDHLAVDAFLQSQQANLASKPRQQLRVYNVDEALKKRFQDLRSKLAPSLDRVEFLNHSDNNRLAVLATENEHEEITSLLEELRLKLAAPIRELRTYDVTETARKRFDDMRRALRPQLQSVTIVDSGRPDKLAVVATSRQHTEIESLLQTLVTEFPEAVKPELKLYTVPAAVKRQFTAAMPTLKQSLDVEFTVITNDRENELLLSAKPDAHRLIAEAIKKLESESSPAQRQFVGYPIKMGDVESMQSLLSELYPDAKIVSDAKSGQLLVWAEAEYQQQIKVAIEQMDVEPSDRNKNKMAYYRLGELDARDVLQMFRQLTPEMTILSDRRTNSLIAWGSEKDHATLSKSVEQIRQQDDKNHRSAVVYKTGSRDPLDVRGLLVKLIPDATVVHDRNTGVVMVWATAEEHVEVAKIVKQVKGRDTSDATVKVYSTIDMDADAVIAMVRDLVPDAQLFDAAGDTKVVALVTADEHETIGSLIREMTTEDPNQPTKSLQAYPVAVGAANQVRTILDDAIPNSIIAFSDDERTVTVYGSPDDQQVAAKTVETTAEVQQQDVTQVVRSYPTPNVDADYITSLLSEMIPSGRFYDAARDTQVIAVAADEHHARVEQLVRDMNSKGDTQDGLALRTFPVFPDVANQVEDILSEAIPNATIAFSADERTISVWGDEAALKLAQSTVESALKAKKEADVAFDDRQTKTYRFENASPASAIPPLSTLIPEATFASDAETSSLIVTATKEQHATIQRVVTDLDTAPGKIKETEIYQFSRANPAIAVTPLSQLLPTATFAVDAQTSSLIATAYSDQHAQIRKVIDELDVAPASKLSTEVYPLEKSTPSAALAALTRLLPNATLAVDNESNSLLATATPEDQLRIAGVLKALDGTSPTFKETRVYQLATADPGAAQRALGTLLPNATIAVDAASGSVIATASANDHTQIAATLEQFDKPTSRTAAIQAYVLKRSDANSVFQTLSQVYRDHPGVRLSIDLPNRSIIAKAPPADQQTIAAIVARMETTVGAGDPLTLEVYPLNTFDATNTIAGLEALFRNESSKPEFKFDTFSSQMFVVATAEQHVRIGDSLERLSGEPTDVEVFQLRAVDSYTVEQAISQLYLDAASGPVVSSDPDTQQLIVRGTRTEIDAIRQLLTKMGEAGLGGGTFDAGSRVVPFRGSIDSAVKQLESVWPRLRKNQLNILKPDRIEINESDVIEERETQPLPPDALNSEPNASNRDAATDSSTATRPVSTTAALTEESQQELPPVFVVPGPSSVTVSSEDPEALRQAESLLRAIARQAGNGSSAGNFAVFRLRNAGARSVAQLLTKLFEQMPETARGSLGRVSLVADERMNAIVVHGRPADRSVLRQLLDVLDTDNADDSLASAVPEIVPVKNTNAERILEILQTVYRSQLERGGSREDVEIPEGIDSEVASVLRQINAATAGPLLTLEVDTVTNSIIVLAPKLLGEQVSKVINRLDNSAVSDDTRTVKIIPLTGVKSEILQDAIERFIDQ